MDSLSVTHVDFELVHHHLPDAAEGAGGTLDALPDTLVRDAVVERVGPEGDLRVGRRDGGVVHEPELLHHHKLAVPADSQERHTHAWNSQSLLSSLPYIYATNGLFHEVSISMRSLRRCEAFIDSNL